MEFTDEEKAVICDALRGRATALQFEASRREREGYTAPEVIKAMRAEAKAVLHLAMRFG